MIYQVERIARDVRTALDQNNISDQLLKDEDIDTLSLEEIIRSKIEEGARRVELNAPTHFLEEGHHFGDSICRGEMGSGWILLPDDFMRLIAFRMSDWERTVYAAVSSDDPIYTRQSSRYPGIRGNIQKPVCAIVNRPEGKVLEFYSCKNENAQIDRATYLPYPTIDENDGIDICERCYRAVVYMTASLVLTAYGDAEKASLFTDLSKTAFG